jgi:prepilin-type N-terminal cleavage/methylation domain-containing protein
MRLFRPVRNRPASPAFTLIEVAVSVAIAALVMAGMFQGYTLASYQSQYSSFQLAANAMAMQKVESIYGSYWKATGVTMTDLFNPSISQTQTNALCLPTSETNLIYATNYATVTQISSNPPYALITVNCVWNFLGNGLHTNTVCVIRAPDE